jgi:hypothetical protein
MANKDFKVKNGLDIQTPLPVSMGGTGQTSNTNTLNSLLPSQAGNNNKVLSTDGTNPTWVAQATAYQRGGTASRPQAPTAGDLYYNTDTNIFEQYTSLGWFPIAVAPGAPTGVTTTNQGTGRAYNNGQMSVAFTPNTSAGAPSSFVVTPSPTTSPSTFTGYSSPVTVTGLASSTQYTYTVTASSAYGTSAASSASAGVTATTVPQAPSLSASPLSGSAEITITPGATGGSTITQYTITSNPVTTTQTTSNTTYTFTGLTDGTAYTFTATATNENGISASSSASNSVTPSSGSLELIQTIPLSGTSVSFTSIPNTYKHLQVWGSVADGRTGAPYSSTNITFNNDTSTSYWSGYIQTDVRSAAPFAGSWGTNTFGSAFYAQSPGASTSQGGWVSNSNIVGTLFLDIMDYSDTSKRTTFSSRSGFTDNSGGHSIRSINTLDIGFWNNTAAVNTITFQAGTGSWRSGSISLYGVKG